MNLDRARTVADAVLYEGYLLYPYRASSAKNQSRWQFGVVGPPGAVEAGLGEASSMRMEVVLHAPEGSGTAQLTVHLRFLHLQLRQVLDHAGAPVPELDVDGTQWTTWDEAVEHELDFDFLLEALSPGARATVVVDGSEETEQLQGENGTAAGEVVRSTQPLTAELRLHTIRHGDHLILELRLHNTRPTPVGGKDEAIRNSLIGAHVLVEATGCTFVSMVDPPPEAAGLVAGCSQDRCWPVLTGDPGDANLLLGSPIILYDYPEIAPESAGSLFDGTEIDEILTLRVMTMTDEEKAEARSTDPRAREIIDRCEQLSPEALQQMHGILRSPHASEPVPVFTETGRVGVADVRNLEPPSFETGDVPWWSPEADASVEPGVDAVVIDGISVARDSLVRVHPSRQADAQDLFFADQVARVTAVLSDVDGGTHVALLLIDDPAADINDLAGRYWYFDPDEVTPLSPDETAEIQKARREEIRP